MKDYSHILELLAQKKALFLELESVSADMPLYQVEELAECMEKRGVIFRDAEQVDEELGMLSASDPELRLTLSNRCNRDGLSPALLAVYDASLGVKAVANRIQKSDGLIKEHLEYEKQRITQRMEELNHSSEKAADKYYRSIQIAVDRPLEAGKNRMI